ncbi:penicillin-binding protein activator [Methylogaea oryzae]|uniref:Penicillin-binding protein activator n=1 Tax=Methylogaea oryzae TaxID=1295382 RepID=A0A8D4VNC7_9GAMM|nr:penicillin-binding protein activator [Methylogaea oryzae]
MFEAARGDLDAGMADAALTKLNVLHPQQLDAGVKLQWHTMRAAAYSLQGDLPNAVKERVAADGLYTEPSVRRRNQEAILEALALLPPERLGGPAAVAGDPLSGWLALGRILAARPTPEAAQQSLVQWRADYPGHPADTNLVLAVLSRGATPPAAAATQQAPASAVAPAQSPAAPPPSSPTVGVASAIAVLLPATGASAAYGEAVRQGIASAYAADAAQPKPVLRFYDSEAGDVAAVYRKAVEEGAEVVIGPLRKEHVAVLAGMDDLAKPTLALNRIEGARDGLFQFGLLPEEELEQAADYAWKEGRKNALLLIPAKDFGQRMVGHFNDYWRQLGGRVMAVQTYLPGEKDFAAPIKKLLQVGEPSKENPQTPRADADAVFFVGDVRDARLIVPQLRYYGATRLPLYATSSVYAGRANRAQDQDLAGVLFCDAPWLLSEAYAAQRQTAWDAWGAHAAANPRLWAMGMDAYRLSRRLPALREGGAPFDGASGGLSLTPGNRIHRQLSCAQFDNGAPVPRAPAAPQATAPAVH